MHTKYIALLSVCLTAHGIAMPENNDAIEQVQNSDAWVDAVDATKHKIEEHKHKHVKTIEIVKSKGGPTMTVVTAPGGPAITLAAPGHGKETTFEGRTYTVIPATFIHPSVVHVSLSHKSSASSSTPSVHIVKTTVSSGKTKATVVSVSGGPAVTLATKGSTTLIGGQTYTVQPALTHAASSSSASHSASGSSSSDSTKPSASAIANVASSASASGSHLPNTAVPLLRSFHATAVGSAVTLVGVLFGALLIL